VCCSALQCVFFDTLDKITPAYYCDPSSCILFIFPTFQCVPVFGLCVSVHCSVLRYVAVCCIVLQCAAWCCSVSHGAVVCCGVLQYVSDFSCELKRGEEKRRKKKRDEVLCSLLQCVAF